MAIKFRDNGPQDAERPRKDAAAKPAKAAVPQADPQPADHGALDGGALAKPEPKKRGRKKAFG